MDGKQRREYMRLYMAQRRQEYPEERARLDKVTRQRAQKRLRDLKGTIQCQQCGENDPRCLDFHHRNPAEKLFTIGSAGSRKVSLVVLEAEVAKCDVLCANCHRKLHSWV